MSFNWQLMTSQWGSRSTLKAHKNVEAKIQTLQKWKNSKLDDFVSSSWANSTNFLKNGPILASFMFIFVLFTFQFKWQIYNLNNKNWKKRRWCAWDSNPGRHDGRHRQIHWAMAAPFYKHFWPQIFLLHLGSFLSLRLRRTHLIQVH